MNKNAKEKQLLEEAYASLYEAKEAPSGKHYDSAGRLRSGDADSDGRGGPKFRSDPTYVNPNEDGEIKVGSFVTTNNGTVVYIDDVDTDRDGKTVYMGTDDDGGDHVLYSDQINAVEDGEGVIDKVADKVSGMLDIGKDWKDGTVFKAKPLIGVARRGAKIANRVGAETLKSGINIAKAAARGATEGGPYKRESRKSLKKRIDKLENSEDNELEDLIAAEDGERFSLFDDKGRVKGGGPSGLAQLDYEDSKEDKEEDAEESLSDQFARLALKVSALEEGRPIDIDQLRLELNNLDEQLGTLGGETPIEDAEEDDKEEEDDVDIKQGGGTSASEFEAEDKTAFG